MLVTIIIIVYFLFDVVLKSDNANGLFGFMSVSAITVEESRNVTLKIERSKGEFGTATVNWSVYKGSSSVRASSDFTLDSGSVVFSENENEKVCLWLCPLVVMLDYFIEFEDLSSDNIVWLLWLYMS